MKHTAGQDTTTSDRTQHDKPVHGEAADHGHTGEGAASALAHLVSQEEKHRREFRDVREVTSRG